MSCAATISLLWTCVAGAVSTSSTPLTLDEAIRIALERHPDLRAARSDVDAASANVDIARAPFLPQVAAGMSFERTTLNSASRPGSESTTDVDGSSVNEFDAHVGVNQLVWDFGRTIGKIDAARETLRSTRETERVAILDMKLSVRTAYFAARAAKALVGVARETLENQERHLAQIRGFVDVGMRPAIDLALARTDRANAEVQRIEAENGYDIARADLARTMGVDALTVFDVAGDGLSALLDEDRPVEELVREALGSRAEIASVGDEIRAQEFAIDALRGDYWPTLGAFVTASEQGYELERLAWNLAGGASLTWNIFQGGLGDAKVREARAKATRLSSERDTLVQRVHFEVARAALALRASKAAIGAMDEAVLAARERLSLAEGRYQAGVSGSIELGDAQVALTSALGQRVRADYDLATARARLSRALGRE